jgi:VanZ family protein
MRQWIRRWWAATLVMVLIFVASATPGNSLPGFGYWDAVLKKGGHMAGYALLALALLHGLSGGKPASRRHAFLAVVLAASYAITDEFHQRFTPGRGPSIADVWIDTLGASIGLLLWALLRKGRTAAGQRDDAAPKP